MVNIQRSSIILLIFAAPLATIAVALARGSTLLFPVRAIIIDRTTFVSWGKRTSQSFAPFSLAFHRAEMEFMSFYSTTILCDFFTTMSALYFNFSIVVSWGKRTSLGLSPFAMTFRITKMIPSSFDFSRDSLQGFATICALHINGLLWSSSKRSNLSFLPFSITSHIAKIMLPDFAKTNIQLVPARSASCFGASHLAYAHALSATVARGFFSCDEARPAIEFFLANLASKFSRHKNTSYRNQLACLSRAYRMTIEGIENYNIVLAN